MILWTEILKEKTTNDDRKQQCLDAMDKLGSLTYAKNELDKRFHHSLALVSIILVHSIAIIHMIVS